MVVVCGVLDQFHVFYVFVIVALEVQPRCRERDGHRLRRGDGLRERYNNAITTRISIAHLDGDVEQEHVQLPRPPRAQQLAQVAHVVSWSDCSFVLVFFVLPVGSRRVLVAHCLQMIGNLRGGVQDTD